MTTLPNLALLDSAATGSGGGPDGGLMLDINTFARATPWLHGVLYACATDGTLAIAALLGAGWWIARRSGEPTRTAAALWAGLGAVLAVAASQPLVAAVREPRPSATLHTLLVLADPTSDYSFPSDHAVLAGAVAAGLLLVHRRLGLLAAAAALLLGFARIYIAAQYPRDVAAGLVLGGLVVLVGWTLLRAVLTVFVRWLSTTRLRPLVTSAPARSSTEDNRDHDQAGQHSGRRAHVVAEPISDTPSRVN